MGTFVKIFSCSFKGWKPEARAADLAAADCGESGGSLDPVGSLAVQILWEAARLVSGWLGFCEDTWTLPRDFKPYFVVQERFVGSSNKVPKQHPTSILSIVQSSFSSILLFYLNADCCHSCVRLTVANARIARTKVSSPRGALTTFLKGAS